MCRGAEFGSDYLLLKVPMEIKYDKHCFKMEENEEIRKAPFYNNLKEESNRFFYKVHLAQKLKTEITGRGEEIYEKQNTQNSFRVTENERKTSVE